MGCARAMPQFQAAGTRLEEQRGEHKEVLATHECDLDIRVAPENPLEVSGGGDAAESAAEYDDAHDSLSITSKRGQRTGFARFDVSTCFAADALLRAVH
jgi:hypothetical protein